MTDLALLKAWGDALEFAVHVDRTTAPWDESRADVCFAIADAYRSRAAVLETLPAPEGEAEFRLAIIATDIEYAADMRLRAQLISEGSPQPHAFKRLDERERRRREYLRTFKR